MRFVCNRWQEPGRNGYTWNVFQHERKADFKLPEYRCPTSPPSPLTGT
jgi:hypothetical protein